MYIVRRGRHEYGALLIKLTCLATLAPHAAIRQAVSSRGDDVLPAPTFRPPDLRHATPRNFKIIVPDSAGMSRGPGRLTGRQLSGLLRLSDT
jgi:hypothetical protein